MRKTLILVFSAFMLLCVVACNNDPYIYKYDETSYLGSWQIDLAPIEGDVDGCIQLLQYDFKSDLTYEVIEYRFNARTEEVLLVEDFDEGFFEYDYDEDTAIGTITLDGGPAQFFWTDGEGLSTILLGRQYNFIRPKYAITKAEDQKDIIGVWERRSDSPDTYGIYIRQLEFKTDGTYDDYNLTGTSEPEKMSETYSWKYKDAVVEKSYSVAWSGKWMFGSEIYVSGPSTAGEPLHDKRNSIITYQSFNIIDDGESSVTDISNGKINYTIFQYGDKRILDYGGFIYVNVSERIDLSEKYKEIVLTWDNGLAKRVYLRSDGTYGSNLDNLLNYDRANDTGYYTGNYNATYNEVTTGDIVAFKEKRFRVEFPGIEPDCGWDTWYFEKALEIETLKTNNYVRLFIGTITFTPDFGFEETFDFMLMIQTAKYGDEDVDGEPVTEYSLTIRNVDKEGNINYLDFTEF